MTFEHQELLTPYGRLWNLYSQETRRFLCYNGSNAEVAFYAVTEFGFIYLRQSGNRVLVRLRADAFPQHAFEALASELSRRHPARIVVEIVTVAAARKPAIAAEIFHSLQDVLAYLDALRSLTPGEIERPQFFSTELDLARLKGASRQQLRWVYNSWLRTKGEISGKRISDFLNDPLDAPFLLTRQHKNNAIIVETWPKYITLVPQDEVPKILGGLIEELPYPGTYPVHAAAAFQDVSRREIPILDFVEAVIHYQFSPPRRVRYERLCLPWRGPGGERFISTISTFKSKRVVGG